jgi:hypothetical protein
MQFMVIVKATPESEAGVMPTETELTEMLAYNTRLVEAGVMRAGEGLLSSAKGARVDFSAGEPVVTDGPFAETKELVAGFWIWEVASLDEAVEWAKQIPFQSGQVEIRQIASDEDFGEEFTPELREAEARLREVSQA